MALKRKFYPKKKFAINEISNTFTEVASELKINPENLRVGHHYTIDDIQDRDVLTIKEVGRITEIMDTDALSLNLNSNSRSIVIGAYSGKMHIIVEGESINEVKHIFSIVESGLNLREFEEDSPSDEGVVSENSEIKEVLQIVDTKTDFETDLGPVRLYKEDLIEIIDLINENYKEIYIKIGTYKIPNKSQIEEFRLKFKKNSVNNLTISTEKHIYGSRLALIFTKNYASIRVNNKNDYESMGVLRLLEDKISKKENKILKILTKTNWGYGFGLVLVFVCFFAPVLFIENITHSTYRLIFLICWYVIIFGIIFDIAWISIKRYSVIHLIDSSDESWFDRHKSDIIFPLIVTIVGSLIVAIIVLFIQIIWGFKI